MAAPRYRITQQFLHSEAIGMRGARHGDPRDPVALEVYITPADDLDTHLQEAVLGSSDKVFRLRTGLWAYDIDPAGLEMGKRYTVTWHFQMIAGNDNYSRTSFAWNPIPTVPRDREKVLLYGTLADAAGQPVADARLVMEEYHDYGTLTRRLGTVDIVSDVFGNWSIEVPQGEIRRFVLGEISQIVQMPRDPTRVSLAELKPFQPKDVVRTDTYGYPIPGQDLYELLKARLSDGQALAVLQSTSVVTYSNEINETIISDGDVEILTHEQVAPSTIWVIAHGKDCTPVVSVIDTDDDLMYPEVSYPDRNTVVLTFSQSVAGKAVLICGPEIPLTG